MTLSLATPQDRMADFAAAHSKLSAARAEIEKTIIGQPRVIEQTLVTLAAGGHVLLIGVPGLAKTLLVQTTAKALGLTSSRVQCTPDLMPPDILGSEVLEQDDSGKRHFRFIKGPIFTQLLIADEINRASPRTQSALLQAMQEYEVSIGGHTYPLPAPFHVLATQNPLEQEGTYPLPEAQLDRFLMQIDVEYPSAEAERAILLATTTGVKTETQSAMTADDLKAIQDLVREMPIGESVVSAILSLVRRARPGIEASELVNQYVSWAPGPRASQALMLATRARALLQGRETPSPEDVIALAEPLLKHRMALSFKARGDGVTIKRVVDDLCQSL